MSTGSLNRCILTFSAICAVLSVSACESLNPMSWFDSEEPESPYAGQEAPGSDQDYPDISSVPERPADGLIADTRDRLYEDERENQQAEEAEEAALGGAPPPASGFISPPREPIPAPTQSVTADTMPPPTIPEGLESSDMDLSLEPEPSDMAALLEPAPLALVENTAAIESNVAEPRLVSMKMGTLVFPFGSSYISPDDRHHIRKIVDLAKQKNAVLRVVGHASSFTNDMSLMDHQVANFSISLERAQAIAALILADGFDHDRLLIGAVSDSEPLFLEVMPAGRQGNQRAEIYMEY